MPTLASWLREQAHLSEPVLSEAMSTLEANDVFHVADMYLLRELTPSWSNLFTPPTARKISGALDGLHRSTRQAPQAFAFPRALKLNCSTVESQELRWELGCIGDASDTTTCSPAMRLRDHLQGIGLKERVRNFLHGRWVLLVGDSTMRMLYHHFIMLLLNKHTVWPAELSSHMEPGACFDDTSLAVQSWVYDQPERCLEDFQLDGVRLTMAWTRFGDVQSLTPLGELLNNTVGVPDLALVGVGAWWVSDRAPWAGLGWEGPLEEQYARAVAGCLTALEEMTSYRRRVGRPPWWARESPKGGWAHAAGSAATYLKEAWRRTVFVWMQANDCGHLSRGGAKSRLPALLRTAMQVVSRREGWHLFDRAAIPSCDLARDCAGPLHPVGQTLNVHVSILVHTCERALIRDPPPPRDRNFANGSSEQGAA